MPRSRSRSFEVHGPLGDPLVVAEGARLREKAVDQGCLPVIDMGNDGYVPEIHDPPSASRPLGM